MSIFSKVSSWVGSYEKMDIFQSFQIGELYEEMWKAIIRPPRDFYTVCTYRVSSFI